MGGSDSKPQPQVRQPTMEEVLIDMRMASKRFEADSRRAEKEKNNQLKKARTALQKGNEEGAKLFIANAATKEREQKQMLQMAHKLDALTVQIKANTSSTTMMDSINRITPLLQMQSANIPAEQLYANMNQFQQAMDEIVVSGKVMDNTLGQQMGQDVNQDVAVDNMLQQLKQENMNDLGNDMQNNTALYNELQNPNQQQMNQQQQNDQFINDLKKM